MIHPCSLPVDVLLKDCQATTSRGSGPGGQHRNKTDSAVVLTHRPTGVTGQASERRSQIENQQKALKRLRVNLALEVRSAEQGERAPSELWRRRCPQTRIVINPEHADFATLLAEALDVIAYRHAQFTHAAEQLVCTSTQLRKFLRLEPRAWLLVNRWRKEYGLPSLD